jgi:hypothetical protein
MRNMSMLQLLGGVAVAGAVAAGTTAFTATAGLVTTNAKAPMMGGSANVSVTGPARLVSATFRIGDSAEPNHITGLTVSVDDGSGNAINATSTVQVAFNGIAAGSAPATGVYFPCSSGGGMVWNCDFATPASDYYTAVDSVDVWVQPLPA